MSFLEDSAPKLIQLKKLNNFTFSLLIINNYGDKCKHLNPKLRFPI